MVKMAGLIMFLILMMVPAFAMGGSPPQEEPQQQKVEASTDVTDRVTELDKARSDMKMEKAELSRLEKSVWALDMKQAEARKKADTKKLLQLKEQEQDIIEKARLIQGSIAKRLEKYPELKVSEAIQKSTAVKPAVMPETDQVELPVPAMTKPAAAVKPKPEATVIIHTVQAGDTLYSVSRKYFGSPSYYKEIAKTNNLLPTEGLYVGMTLKIDMGLKGIVVKKPVVQTPKPETVSPVEDLPTPVEDTNL